LCADKKGSSSIGGGWKFCNLIVGQGIQLWRWFLRMIFAQCGIDAALAGILLSAKQGEHLTVLYAYCLQAVTRLFSLFFGLQVRSSVYIIEGHASKQVSGAPNPPVSCVWQALHVCGGKAAAGYRTVVSCCNTAQRLTTYR
jgi:hypothetical protein